MGRVYIACALVIVMVVVGVESHARMKTPPARTDMYVEDKDKYKDEPPYWNAWGLMCYHQDEKVSTCGRCGGEKGAADPDLEASQFIQGGKYGKNIITANYTSGSVIEIVSDKGAWHWGYIYFELCPEKTETDDCFQMLQVVSATTRLQPDSKYNVCVALPDDSQPDQNSAKVQLPAGVKCDRCTLRWTYRTAYPGPQGWTNCWVDPREVQVFRNCADIAIH